MKTHNGMSIEEAITRGDARAGYSGSFRDVNRACTDWLRRRLPDEAATLKEKINEDMRRKKK